jgi:predicted deacetylase
VAGAFPPVHRRPTIIHSVTTTRSRPPDPPALVVSVHDVATATADQTARWCSDMDGLGIPVSLLVIPGPWRGGRLADAPDLARALAARARTGDEIVLHGLRHTAGPEGPWHRRAVARLVARGAAEFAALDLAQARDRLRAGRAELESVGLRARGFTPPGWLASPGTVAALRAEGFAYLTTHRGLHDLTTGATQWGFALSHRPGGAGERLGAQFMGAWARRTAGRGGLVRIALHPDDLSRTGLRGATLRTIEAVLAGGGRATTYGSLAGAAAAVRGAGA